MQRPVAQTQSEVVLPTRGFCPFLGMRRLHQSPRLAEKVHALGIIVIAFIVSRMNQAQRNASARSLDETKNTAPNITHTHALTSAAIVAMVIGTLTGPILGVWCSLYALQKLEVGIATTLMSLVPVMILPVTRITEGRWPSTRAILGALIAVAGVAVLATAPHAATV